MAIPARTGAPVSSESDRQSCPHMITLAEHHGVKRHPVTGQYWVKECARRSCRGLILEDQSRCCYCGGTQFKDMDHKIKIEVGVCTYHCRDCKKQTQGCELTRCIHCNGGNIALLPPRLMVSA
jgi:hypothetical protein